MISYSTLIDLLIAANNGTNRHFILQLIVGDLGKKIII